ncbi:MAG: zinc ribbon domain-containing protein [Spirochaetia bacterium]|nr:zinc ribbon domain-containing protein [Spirochaetia bacterium]
MPTYDYKCKKCENVFEKFHSMTENPKVLCSKCDSPAEKQIGAGSGIVFKGSGFYTTDYKKQNQCPKAESKSSSEKPKSCGSGCPAM